MGRLYEKDGILESIKKAIAEKSGKATAEDVKKFMDDAVKKLEEGINSATDIWTAGKSAFDDFNIDNAYVKSKHLPTTSGNRKVIGTKGENLVKIVISSDGGMLSAYPVK